MRLYWYCDLLLPFGADYGGIDILHPVMGELEEKLSKIILDNE